MTDLATASCPRSPIPRGQHCFLRSVTPAGPAVCNWCGVTADPVADLGDPPPPKPRRQAGTPDESGELFEGASR